MGSSKSRKQKFLLSHRICFYCGSADATTIDHVPARECFNNRVGPEEFEFPACKTCNNSTGKMEQAAAFLIRCFDFDENNHSEEQFRKLFMGTRNNLPGVLPSVNLTANQKRQLLKAAEYSLPSGETYSSLPLALISEEARVAMEQFSRKLTCALFYKHVGRPLPIESFIRIVWFPYASPHAKENVERFDEILPDYTLSKRQNTNIGEQFHYRYGVKEDTNLFAFLAQFGRSIFISGIASDTIGPTNSADWIEHRNDLIFR